MKKLALTALAAAFATIGLASVASADSRSGDDEWRRHGRHDDAGRRDDRRGDDRQAHRDRGRDEWRHGDRRPHWRHTIATLPASSIAIMSATIAS